MKKLFDTLLAQMIMPALKAKLPGFRRSGRTLRRKVNDVEQIVNVQTMTDANGVRVFTINLGVLSLPMFEIKWSHDYKRTVWSCHWDERIGFLQQKGKRDVWWPLRSYEEAQAAVEEVMPLLDAGLKRMNELDSTQCLLEYWETQDPGYYSGKIRLAKQALGV